MWPRWLPEQARLPLVAQITGAVALTALIVGPWWARLPDSSIVPASSFVHPSALAPLAPIVTPSPASDRLNASALAARPAHLNLDVRHTFKNIDLSVTVDGTPALSTQLDGSSKRFKMFGKRAERGFTQTLDLAPGVHVVRVRMRSTADKFDQTRVERFDLAAASVATIQLAADKSGLTLVAKHPPAPKAPAATLHAAVAVAPPAAPPSVPAPAHAAAPPAVLRSAQAESTMLELVQSLRSMLIAIAGFVASAATGFVVQEFMRRRALFSAGAQAPARAAGVPSERRRRRRARLAEREATLEKTDHISG